MRKSPSKIEDVMCQAESRFGIPLKRKTAREAGGPCPFCGTGVDRFLVFRDGGYWCRQCNKGGVIDRAVVRRYVPPPITPPSSQWQRRAWYHVNRLTLTPWAIDYLGGRGIREATARLFHIKHNPRNTWERASLWGLEGRDIFLSKGIVIPHIAGREIWGFKVRRVQEPKYSSPRGRKVSLFGSFQGTSSLILCEGEFDMMIAAQETGLDAATFGGVSITPRGRWLSKLMAYERVYIAYDMDDHTYKWRVADLLGKRAVVLSWQGANDLNDYYLAGGDIGELVN